MGNYYMKENPLIIKMTCDSKDFLKEVRDFVCEKWCIESLPPSFKILLNKFPGFILIPWDEIMAGHRVEQFL